ncbi:CynX/NimT family MFS transporter [Pseudonocardia alaniniphila]|uniref:MFS transporter n=1 Tax=Pseudonocardia alaniniphila TaxID=75291 RepID=A0ABS9TT99_9PSEU|nr:MFS transporter [Pseudonocardia alaniniphila]MCH6171795.1 MFS transporter [Pseudonocardia alaniniphila]
MTPPRSTLLPAVGVILLGANLRPLVVAVSPLLGAIRADTGLSVSTAGLLTTLPVLCFGVLAPLAPRLGRRLGIELTLLLTMVLITAGAAVRLLQPLAALLAGTVLIGAGIAIANVLLPGVIKRDFERRVGLMTGLYTMTLFASPALAAGLSVPLERATGLGWRRVLALWGVLAVAAIIVWLPQTRRRTRVSAADTKAAARPVCGLWRNPLAWAVTCFMGLQAMTFYMVAAWLPTLLADAGMSGVTAGVMLSLSSVVGIAGAFLAPMLAGGAVRTAAIVVAGSVLYVIALGGLLVAPIAGAYLWMSLLGLGQGAAISLALLFIVQRAPDIRHAAQLSSMSQCFGYVLAALGPLALGVVHQATGGWTIPLLLVITVLIPQTLSGVLAARDGHVSGYPDEPPVEGELLAFPSSGRCQGTGPAR